MRVLIVGVGAGPEVAAVAAVVVAVVAETAAVMASMLSVKVLPQSLH